MGREAALDEAARAEGWTSRGQKYRAGKAGITDPAEWAAHTARTKDTVPPNGDGVVWSEPSLDDAVAEHPTLDLQGGDTGTVQHLPIDRVHPAGDNPRRNVDVDDDMVASVKAIGILQPLIVTVHPDQVGHWLIVAGHRRHLAAHQADLATVPALVREFTPVERVEAMLVENLQRKDLDPFDEAHGFQQLADLGRTQREIADRVGRNQSHISRRLKLVHVEPELVAAFTAGQVPLRVLEELAVLGPEIRHAAIGILQKSPGIHESNIIPNAEKAVATAAVRLKGKNCGLPEWTGKHWDVTPVDKIGDATHWHVHEAYTVGHWQPTFRLVREITRDIPGDQRQVDPAEKERRAREQAEREAAAAAKNARIEQRRAFITAHLDVLTDLATRLVVIAPGTDFLYEDELDGPLRLLGHDGPAPGSDSDADYVPHDTWIELATAATSKRQTLRMFAARVLDAAEYHFNSPATWGDRTWCPLYLIGLEAVGWELDDTESAIAHPPADADGITDDDEADG